MFFHSPWQVWSGDDVYQTKTRIKKKVTSSSFILIIISKDDYNTILFEENLSLLSCPLQVFALRQASLIYLVERYYPHNKLYISLPLPYLQVSLTGIRVRTRVSGKFWNFKWNPGQLICTVYIYQEYKNAKKWVLHLDFRYSHDFEESVLYSL